MTVESSFADNRPLINGHIAVKDKTSGALLLEGSSDSKGIFTFTVPPKEKKLAKDILVVVSGSAGHQSEWLIPATEYLTETTHSSVKPSTALDNQKLKQVLEELLDQKLAPIKRSLAESKQNKPGFRDIMGGIGYLLGLAGLVAWLRNRPQKQQSVDD